jgi:hypothetical protein
VVSRSIFTSGWTLLSEIVGTAMGCLVGKLKLAAVPYLVTYALTTVLA